MDYNQLVRQVNEMDDLSACLNTEIIRLEDLYARMGSEWKGPAADEFRKQLMKLIADMKRTKESISNASREIENVANIARNGGGAW